MIRKLQEKDRKKVLEYLYKEKSYNIFIIGDIETFGFDVEFQHVYGEFDQDENYLSVLLFYRANAIYYSHQTRFNDEYMEMYQKHNPKFLSGKRELTDLLLPYFPDYKQKPMHFCKATTITEEVSLGNSEIKTLKTEKEFRELFQLLRTIDEFGVNNTTEEEYVASRKSSLQMGLHYGIYENGELAATAATTAETTQNAMIVGVATGKKYRKKGYASQLVVALMKEYFENRNKELCLFYDNKAAGKIYLRLGFEDIGDWAMMDQKQNG